MDARITALIRAGDDLFSKKLPLDSLWQEIADNFYPQRATFTASRSLGEDFAANLSTSYPIMACRDLGNAFSAMLRPKETEWFKLSLAREERMDNAAKRWLEDKTKVQKRAMYDRVSQFVRATKQGDHDFAAFGQCVLSVELNRDANALLYRCWHLRDVAWSETYDGKVGTVHRKWTPTAIGLKAEFKDKIHEKVQKLIDKTPYATVKCRHIVVPSDEYEPPPGKKKWKTPYVSVFIDIDHGHVMEEVGVYNSIYVIPRWQTVSGSQYAYSPATVAALPDARLIQAMTLTLLEAGEKAVNPPLIGVQEAIRSDIQVFPGGITMVDMEYDERLGEALRPMTIDSRGIPLGMEMRADARAMIAEAFYLNKIGLPAAGGRDMTAYETGQRIQEYIRNALPLFEPMEMDYNGALCDATFDILLRHGAFGSPQDMPDSLKGQEVQFRFESPLHEAAEKQKGQIFLQTKAILAEAAALDPSAMAIFNAKTAIRDVLGSTAPAKWLNDEEQVQAIEMADKQQAQTQQLLATMTQGGAAAKSIADAGSAIQGLGIQ